MCSQRSLYPRSSHSIACLLFPTSTEAESQGVDSFQGVNSEGHTLKPTWPGSCPAKVALQCGMPQSGRVHERRLSSHRLNRYIAMVLAKASNKRKTSCEAFGFCFGRRYSPCNCLL